MVVKTNEKSLLNIYLTFRWIFYVNDFVDLVMCYYLRYVGQVLVEGQVLIDGTFSERWGENSH